MRKIFTCTAAFIMGTMSLNAQTVATFETLPLVGTDTFYINTNNPKTDMGFDDGLAHFPYFYDTAWGGSWSDGVAYTNQTDLSDSSYNNLYTSVTGKGYNNSAKYVSVSAFSPVVINLKGKAVGQPVKGFYATNLLYAYKEMTTVGFSKKLGGVPNTEPDWFKLTVKGYLNGSLKPDSVDFFLADFRDPDSTKDYVVTTWEWVNLLPLGNVDSLSISLSSTDTAGGFGMNNPAYFAMDNFTTYETSGVGNNEHTYIAKVYPNPATNKIYIELGDESVKEISVMDISGRVVGRYMVKDKVTLIPVKDLANGIYILNMQGENGIATGRFIKQ